MTHSSLVAQCRADTPLGPVTLAATERGLAGLWFDGQAHHPGPLAAPVDAGQRWLQLACRELQAYFAGAAGSRGPVGAAGMFSVPIDAGGTPFQAAVWGVLRALPLGATATYGDVAARAGRPAAIRAAAAAIARNPVSIVVPCHRVVGRDGALTGYAGGLDRKRALLVLEGAVTAGSRQAAAAPPHHAGLAA